MDEITREDVSPQIEGELTLPSPPKRPKTDCTMTNNHSGKIRFDFPELFTFRQTIGSPSSASTLQESAGQVGIAECGDIEDEKPHEQQEDTQLVVTAITRLTTSHTEDAHTGSSKVGMIAGERCFNPLVRDEQPPVTETDKLSSYPADDAGGAIAESHTSKDPSSHPDCKSLGKSLEDEAPGGCSLHAGNDKDWRQVRNRLSPIQKFTLSSSDEGVRCQSDCSYEDALRDTGFCKTLSQSADVEESNLKRDEHGFSENILFSKEGEEGNRHISFSEYADCESIYPAPEDQPSENLAERVQYEEKILELQICGNGNVAMCDGGTKGQIYENGMSKNSIPFAAEYAERSIVSNDVVLARNITIESVSIEAEYFCGEREHAGNMIAKAWSETADHTTETPMPARISQEPAEGNNDASPFSVFDPAIWSETDRKAEEKPCNSESTAGVKLFPSVKVCVMETPLSLCFDARLSQEVSAPTHTGQCEDEKDDLWQSYTEPKACTITTNRTHKTDNKGTCVWKSSPSSTPCRPAKPHAKDEKQESNDTLRHQLKEQDPSGSSPVGPDHLKTQEVEYLQTEKQEREGMTRFKEELRTDEHVKSDNSSGLEEKLLQQHEKHIEELSEMLTDDCFSNWTEEIISTYGNNLTHINKELGNWKNIECLLDHPYSVTVSTMEGTTEEKDRKEEARVGEETDVHGNSEIVVKSHDHPQQQSQQNGDMTEQCISECADGNMSKSSHKLTLVSQHEQENKLRCFSDTKHRAETFMVEHKEDILAFTSPPTSDAVVPGPHELPHSQNADNPTAPNCNNTFSPVPSGYTFNSRVPGGFDTFEKIQLSLDDDDDDASLSNSPVLSSEAGQLYQFMPESNKHLEVPEEEEEEEEEKEMEIFECQTDNMAKGLTCSDTSCKDLTNFISAADVMALGSPEQQPNCESSYSSSECFHDDFNPQSMSSPVLPKSNSLASDVNDSPKFEMEKQFDMVLKELNLFFDISISDLASDSRAPSPEQSDDVTGVLEGDTSNCKEHLSSPELGPHRDTSSNGADEDCSLELCGGDPVVSCSSGSGDGEQEVPLGSHPCQETSMYTAEKHIEPQEMEQKRKMWSPSFECQPFLEQLSHRQPEQPRRLEPLKTCSRPIRVGLSKRAKTKHLHHLHAYK